MDEYPIVRQPPNMKINLFSHQLTSIYNMEKIERERKIIVNDDTFIETQIGVFADRTGYGKTLSIIGLILRDKMEWDITEPYMSENLVYFSKYVNKHKIKRLDKVNTTLILVTSSIIYQWLEEINKTSNLKVAVVVDNKTVKSVKPEEYEVVLVVPNMYNQYMIENKEIAWKRFVFDEAGNVKIPNMKDVYAGFYWFVSPIPNEIILKHHRCKGFMHDMFEIFTKYDNNFRYLIVKNDDEYITRSFCMTNTYHIYHECYNPIYNVVNGFVSDNVLEMISAGSIQDVIFFYGGKTSSITELVKNKKMEEVEEIEFRIRLYTMRQNNLKINEWNEKKRMVMEEIEELDKRFKMILNDNCSICYNKIEKPVLEPNCQNLFCGECLLTWVKDNNTCPLCRHTIINSELVYVTDTDTDTNKSEDKNKKCNKKLTKLETIIKIIKDTKDGKILICSSYDYSFNMLVNFLKENNIYFKQINGSVKNRVSIIDEFKSGNLNVILLNSSYDAAGINLQETTDIILYHEMADTLYTQIIGRANRIGRKVSLNIHHLQNCSI